MSIVLYDVFFVGDGYYYWVANRSYPGSQSYFLFIADELNQIRSLKGLKIIHLNARSLLAHWEEIGSEFLTLDFEVVSVIDFEVVSVIDYGGVLYDGANKKELDNVQRLQNCALHIISQC